MSNLTNLTNKIIEDAKKEAAKIIEKATATHDEIIRSKKAAAKKKAEAMVERATQQAIQLKEQKMSNARIRARDEKLRAKGEIIERVLEIVLEKLMQLDDETYVQFLQNRFEKLSLEGNERLIVPEDKYKIVKRMNLPVVLEKSEDVTSGFHLIDEQFIMNHSFDTLVAFYKDDLKRTIAHRLFNEER